MTLNKDCGFTLIEVMVVVVILAILASVALPSYNDYIIRSRITQAINGLSTKQTQMEQCYQDNHTYAPTGGCTACAADTSGRDFNFSCAATATSFTLTATGKGVMAPFTYTVDHAGAKTTTLTSVPSGWTVHNPNNCWIIGKAGAC